MKQFSLKNDNSYCRVERWPIYFLIYVFVALVSSSALLSFGSAVRVTLTIIRQHAPQLVIPSPPNLRAIFSEVSRQDHTKKKL